MEVVEVHSMLPNGSGFHPSKSLPSRYLGTGYLAGMLQKLSHKSSQSHNNMLVQVQARFVGTWYDLPDPLDNCLYPAPAVVIPLVNIM